MIVVILQGGLSNQMFQYAAARRLAMRRKTKLYIDTSWYDRADQSDGVDVRQYELAPLSIEENLYHPTLFKRLLLKRTGAPFNDDDNPYAFHKQLSSLPNNSRLFGFFQNEKYFKDIRKILLKEFTLRDAPTGKNKTLLKQIISDDNAVSIHVRRGDYVTSASHSAHHGAKGLDYYDRAIKKITKSVKSPNFYIFSDDPKWTKANLKTTYPTTYISHNTYGAEDMRLMRACRHNIIANSSFSWWGAWLNENPKKIVIAPKKWIQSADYDASDIILKDWIKL